MLKIPMQRADRLQCVEAGEGEDLDSLCGLGAPQMNGLWHEQRGVQHHAETEDERDDVFHAGSFRSR